jgi:hypothetical protein
MWCVLVMGLWLMGHHISSWKPTYPQVGAAGNCRWRSRRSSQVGAAVREPIHLIYSCSMTWSSHSIQHVSNTYTGITKILSCGNDVNTRCLGVITRHRWMMWKIGWTGACCGNSNSYATTLRRLITLYGPKSWNINLWLERTKTEFWAYGCSLRNTTSLCSN